jgi:hypothetical protein
MFSLSLTAPWSTFTTPGASVLNAFANPSTGQILATSDAGAAQSIHNEAGVRSAFFIPAGTTFISASTSLSVAWFTWIWCFWFSYASSEALVTLRLFEPGQFQARSEHRFSFARPWSWFFGGWSSGDQVTPVQLNVGLVRPPPAPPGIAIVEVVVEAWAGAGGIAGAGSRSSTTVPSISAAGFP